MPNGLYPKPKLANYAQWLHHRSLLADMSNDLVLGLSWQVMPNNLWTNYTPNLGITSNYLFR